MSCVNFKFHHGGYFVRDMNTSIEWYQRVLDFEVVYKGVQVTPLPDGSVLNLEIVQMRHDDLYLEMFSGDGILEDKIPGFKYGTHHVCYYTSDEDFPVLVQHLKDEDVVILFEAHHTEDEGGKPGGTDVMYIMDPDGAWIEFVNDYHPGSYNI